MGSVLIMLETNYRVTLGCHGGSLPLFDNYDPYIFALIILNHLFSTLSKY